MALLLRNVSHNIDSVCYSYHVRPLAVDYREHRHYNSLPPGVSPGLSKALCTPLNEVRGGGGGGIGNPFFLCRGGGGGAILESFFFKPGVGLTLGTSPGDRSCHYLHFVQNVSVHKQ